MAQKIRILIAKPGLDGHEAGAKMVARALMDGGMEVIYTGSRQTSEAIVQTAIQEDVDIIGISILTGAYLHYCSEILQLLKERGGRDIPLVLGGIIHPSHIPALEKMGVKGIFGPGTDIKEMVDSMQQLAKESKAAQIN